MREGERDGAWLTQIQMNAGNEGVEEEHDDHHSQDGDTLDQEDLVSDSVL